MNKTRIKKFVEEQIKKMEWVTYPQLLRSLSAEGVNVVGSYQMEMTDKNIVLWGGLSETVVNVLTDLITEGKIVAQQAPIELYKLDGVPTTHPLTLVVPDKAFQSPVIFLTVLRYVPQPAKATPNSQ